MKLLQITVLISLLSIAFSWTCYMPQYKEERIMETSEDIANNLDRNGVMDFETHEYKWNSKTKPTDNISLRFQFQRTGNKESSIMFIPHYSQDYFQLVLKQRTMIVTVVSSNYDKYVEEFPISSSVDRKLTWFSFSFFKDHVEVYYDRKLVGEFKAKLRLQMFYNIRYTINSFSDYYDNHPLGYMDRLETFTDIKTDRFFAKCIGAGKNIYYRNDYRLSSTLSNFLGRLSNNLEEQINEDEDEQ